MRGRKGGFTVVEMLVVIAIIVTLAGLLLAGIGTARRHAKKKATLLLFNSISLALERFRDEEGFLPDASGGPSSSEKLYRALTAKKGMGPFLPSLPPDQACDTDGNGLPEILDAWRRPIRYTEGRYLPDGRDFELRSAGGDGEFGTEDDVVL